LPQSVSLMLCAVLIPVEKCFSKSMMTRSLTGTCQFFSRFPGSSPVMISKEQMGPLVQRWVNISLDIKQDPEASTAWGWVQEM